LRGVRAMFVLYLLVIVGGLTFFLVAALVRG
jgi:hypothetical protein